MTTVICDGTTPTEVDVATGTDAQVRSWAATGLPEAMQEWLRRRTARSGRRNPRTTRTRRTESTDG